MHAITLHYKNPAASIVDKEEAIQGARGRLTTEHGISVRDPQSVNGTMQFVSDSNPTEIKEALRGGFEVTGQDLECVGNMG